MNRWIALVVFVTLLASHGAAAEADAPIAAGGTRDVVTSYQDVPTASLFRTSIAWLAEAGITKGCNPPANDQFCPNDPVTRGQMAAFLVRAFKYTDRGTTDFTDDNGTIFEADIERLAAAGVTKGCNPPANDQFCPNDPVTRGQMAAFVHRASGSPTPWMRYALTEQSSIAIGINNSGVAVVAVGTEGEDIDAALWDPRADTITYIDTTTLDNSYPVAMSETGYIAMLTPLDTPLQSYVWNPITATVSKLVGPDWITAEAINESGQTAGRSTTTGDDNPLAFGWSPGDGNVTMLETPATHNSYAADINDDGMIIGATSDPDALTEIASATVWDIATGEATALPTPAGATSAVPVRINNSGLVAGVLTVSVPAGEELVPIAWDLAGSGYSTLELSDIEAAIGQAGEVIGAWPVDLDEEGRILGLAYLTGAAQTRRLFVWEPETDQITVAPTNVDPALPPFHIDQIDTSGVFNSLGVVAFNSRNADHIGWWDTSTGATKIFRSTANGTVAVGINDTGAIAGWERTDSADAVVWMPPRG